jgi:hypothetical protein
MPQVKPKIERAVLVYQAGIANVFAVDSFNKEDHGRNARRLIQHAFVVCEGVAQGLALAGVKVATMYCNRAGDIAHQPWTTTKEDAPFTESQCPVWNEVTP